jgi:hypothetical protein
VDRELIKDNKENEEIDSLIEKLSSSAIEYRNATGDIIFKRLRRLFRTKQKEITRDSRLKEIFSKNFTEWEWEKLEKIGLKIPGLQRAKAYNYLSLTYLIVALGSLFVFSILNLDLVFIVWGLPIFGIILILTCSPIPLFMLVFKRRNFPCDTVDELVDQIISVNWTDLITDDKKLFKEIVRQENEFGGRASAQSSRRPHRVFHR